MDTRKRVKLVPGSLKSFVDTFLRGVWSGMGPDLTKRATTRSGIKKGGRKK